MAKTAFHFNQRSSGLLMHVTSLPGPMGTGDIGTEARAFVDFVKSAGQTWWQMLPVNPPGDPPGNSPYSSNSAFAGSAWLIDPRQLASDGLLENADLPKPRPASNLADYEQSIADRSRLLRKAFEKFDAARDAKSVLAKFHRGCGPWLAHWCLYSAIREVHQRRSWTDWPSDLALRKPAALAAASKGLAVEIRYHGFVQWAFARQWAALKRYANDRGVGLIGDIPIFVGHDSADVWAHRELFVLDRAGQPTIVSGYPPDPFNADGQRWGHPHYAWAAHIKTGWAWWVARFAAILQRFDAVRIDHFLGFDRVWQIPASEPTARIGKWGPGGGAKLLSAIKTALPNAAIIAEDLGQMTPSAAKLREQFALPGMRVMEFGFGSGGEYHLPHNYVPNCVAYLGTHDNNTARGWFNDLVHGSLNGHAATNKPQIDKLRRYLNTDIDTLPWDMIRSAMASTANTVVFQIQDVLSLDQRDRMNTPGTIENNWLWRLKPRQLNAALAKQLSKLSSLYDRTPAASEAGR